MKDKDLLLDNNSHTLEELTDQANKIIEFLENEKDLENSVEKYQNMHFLLIHRRFLKVLPHNVF